MAFWEEEAYGQVEHDQSSCRQSGAGSPLQGLALPRGEVLGSSPHSSPQHARLCSGSLGPCIRSY